MRRAFKYRWCPTPEQAALQQMLRHKQTALCRFFDGKARYPRLKSKRRSKASAEFTRSAFPWRGGQPWLAKLAEPLDIVWSRPLPDGAEPSTVTVSRDQAGRWFVSIFVDDSTQPDALPAWGELVWQLEYKAVWYGRTVVKIERWYPSSKRCSDCGWIVHDLPLDVRAWTCENCGVVHDRDHNAARNILAAGLAVAACGEGVRLPQRHAGNATLVESGTSTREG